MTNLYSIWESMVYRAVYRVPAGAYKVLTKRPSHPWWTSLPVFPGGDSQLYLREIYPSVANEVFVALRREVADD